MELSVVFRGLITTEEMREAAKQDGVDSKTIDSVIFLVAEAERSHMYRHDIVSLVVDDLAQRNLRKSQGDEDFPK